MDSLRLLKKFIGYLRPYWFREVILLILMLLSSVGTLASPYILKIIIDEVFPSRDFNFLLQILGILVSINILRIAISYWADYLYSWVSNHIVLDLRSDLFNHFLHLPMSFYDKNKAGDLIHRINNEVNSIQDMLTGSFMRFINSFFTVLGLTSALCWLNWKLFIISMIVLPFILVNTKYFKPKIHSIIMKAREKDSDVLNFFIERFDNIKLIKSYHRYESENNTLISKIQSLIRFNLNSVILSSGNRSISTFLVTISPILIFVWGGKEVMIGVMTLGSLIAFIQYLNRLFNPIRDILSLYWDLVRSSVSMQRIFEFMSELEEGDNELLDDIGKNSFYKEFSKDHETKKNASQIGIINQLEEIRGAIIFENVCFKYDGHWVLYNLNLIFKKGKKYAIVGPSGCGKSTIINLINRFYNVQAGSIFIDNKEIQKYDLYELRRQIALITQENQLIHESIWENIRYGNFNASDDEIHSAAELTGLYEHIERLKDGFNSIIGDKGTRVSGGLKQRIAISRAILKNAEVIILDEATSALDSESERQIFLNLYDHFRDKTMIIISHRLSTIKDVDEIIYLEKGQAVEYGAYTELIERRELFCKLFHEQIE